MNIPEMIMTILISIGIGKFSEYQSPKYYELETVDGNVYNAVSYTHLTLPTKRIV